MSRRPAVGPFDLTLKFWGKVNFLAPNGCWGWTGARNARGYGVASAYGVQGLAHRLSLSSATGVALSTKLGALHSCDNPPCVNPAHLRWGTQADNALDMVGRSRASKGMPRQSHCRRGHPMTEDNVYANQGGRRCRRCTLDYDKKRKAMLRDSKKA